MSNFKALFYDLKAKAEQNWERSEVAGRIAYELYMKTRPSVEGAVCLDVGIGAGWAIESLLGAGAARVDGIDISQERLDRADRELKAKGLQNYTLRQADAEELIEFESGTYDFVNYLDVLEHLTDYRAGLLEVRRVLKPGGRVYIKTPNQYTDLDLQIHHQQALLSARLLPGIIAPPEGNELMLRDDVKFLSDAEVAELKEAIPEGFHEHNHQFYPDELRDELLARGFEIELLEGTPLLIDILFVNEARMKHLAGAYSALVDSGALEMISRAAMEDLMAAGLRPEYRDLPPGYVFSDNLIVVARKP